MADEVTITNASGIAEYHGWSTNLEGRIYPLTGYMAADGVIVPASSPYDGKGAFYWRADAEVAGGVVTLDDFVGVKPTLTSPDNPGARLGLFLFDVDTGRMVTPVTGLESFALAADASQDLEDVLTANAGTLPAAVPHDVSVTGDMEVGGDFSVGGNTTLSGTLALAGGFASAPSAPAFKVNGVQVVGAQGPNIPDPDGTLEGNTDTIQQLLDLFRDWGAVSSLYRSTLNDSLVSLWQLNNVNDAHGGNHLTNNGGVTFDSLGANFSGANHLSVADSASFHISYRQSWTVAARVRLNSKATSQAIVSKTDGASANEFSLFYVSLADGFDRFRFNVYPGGTGFTGVTASSAGSPSTGTDYLLIAWYDARNHTINIQVDNGAVDSAAATLTSHPYTASLAIGALSGSSNKLNGSVRFVGLWSKELTAEERQELYDNQNALTYPLQDDTTARTEYLIQNYQLFDNRAEAWAGPEPNGYFYALPYSRAIFTTAATSMDVEEFCNTDTEAADARQINVRVNGADYAIIQAPGTGGTSGAVTTHTVTLPPGPKTVEVWTGLQTLHVSGVVGTWLRRISFNALAQIKTPENKAPHMIVYGDSISIGGGADVPCREGWTMLLRDAWPGSLAVDGWGGRSLYQDAPNNTARAEFVQKLVTQNPDVLWLSIGTNDYGGVGFGEQSAASFGTAYAALLDEAHALLPALVIYAQSPFLRTSEAANVYGNTLPQYRTQISTACASRAWATFVDGTAVTGFSVPADLDDVVHPNTGGHAKIAAWAEGVLGV